MQSGEVSLADRISFSCWNKNPGHMWKWCSIESKKMYDWAYKLKVNWRTSTNLDNDYSRLKLDPSPKVPKLLCQNVGKNSWQSLATSVITAKAGHQTFHPLVRKWAWELWVLKSQTLRWCSSLRIQFGQDFSMWIFWKHRVWKWLSGWEEVTDLSRWNLI